MIIVTILVKCLLVNFGVAASWNSSISFGLGPLVLADVYRWADGLNHVNDVYEIWPLTLLQQISSLYHLKSIGFTDGGFHKLPFFVSLLLNSNNMFNWHFMSLSVFRFIAKGARYTWFKAFGWIMPWFWGLFSFWLFGRVSLGLWDLFLNRRDHLLV